MYSPTPYMPQYETASCAFAESKENEIAKISYIRGFLIASLVLILVVIIVLLVLILRYVKKN